MWLILIVPLQTIPVSNNRDKAFSSSHLVTVYSTEQIRFLTFVQLTALTMSVGKRRCIGLRYFTAEDFRCQLCRCWSEGDPLIQPDEKKIIIVNPKHRPCDYHFSHWVMTTYRAIVAPEKSQREVVVVKVTLSQALYDHYIQGFYPLLMEESAPAAKDKVLSVPEKKVLHLLDDCWS